MEATDGGQQARDMTHLDKLLEQAKGAGPLRLSEFDAVQVDFDGKNYLVIAGLYGSVERGGYNVPAVEKPSYTACIPLGATPENGLILGSTCKYVLDLVHRAIKRERESDFHHLTPWQWGTGGVGNTDTAEPD